MFIRLFKPITFRQATVGAPFVILFESYAHPSYQFSEIIDDWPPRGAECILYS